MSSARSLRASAKATLASRNPALLPQSNRRPSKRRPWNGTRPMVRAMASVNWISPPAPGIVALEFVEDFRLKDVAADDGKRRGRHLRRGLLDQALGGGDPPIIAADVENAVTVGLLARHVLHRHQDCRRFPRRRRSFARGRACRPKSGRQPAGRRRVRVQPSGARTIPRGRGRGVPVGAYRRSPPVYAVSDCRSSS